ncbi:hypothetical protein V6N13_107144 [Hibiscus sabdariffa]
MEAFHNALLQADLSNLKHYRGWLTWFNGDHANLVREHLDKFVTDTTWLQKFENFRVVSKYSAYLDHCLLIFDTNRAKGTGRFIGDDYFRFDVCWSKKAECLQRVAATWQQIAGCTIDKLKVVVGNLHGWQNNCMRDL